MNQSFFNQYLERIQNDVLHEESIDLTGYILFLKKAHHTDPVLSAFLKAEFAFHSEKYNEALKYYLEARHIPLFHFFCYRVSAYLSFHVHQPAKAIKFIKKALDIKPDDFFSLKLLSQLYLISEELEKAQEIKNIIATLKNQQEPNEKSFPQNFSVSEQEVDEFFQIMAKCENASEMLFAHEQNMDGYVQKWT